MKHLSIKFEVFCALVLTMLIGFQLGIMATLTFILGWAFAIAFSQPKNKDI